VNNIRMAFECLGHSTSGMIFSSDTFHFVMQRALADEHVKPLLKKNVGVPLTTLLHELASRARL
jgi:hypothetical protein